MGGRFLGGRAPLYQVIISVGHRFIFVKNFGFDQLTDGDVDAPEAWAQLGSGGSPDIVIAIIDTGVDLDHEDLDIWQNPGETGNGKETNGIDDDENGYVDDYHGWSASPPKYRSGVEIPWATGYTRSVNGAWLEPDDLTQVSGTETGVKATWVTVGYDGKKLLTLSAVRTRAWQGSVGQ